MIRTRLGLRIIQTIAPSLMPNTQQWNVPAATQINDTDKLSGSQGPNVGQDKTFSWALVKTTLTAFFAASFSGLQTQITALQALTKTNPTYAAPSLNQAFSNDGPGNYEVGQTVSGNLTISLNVADSGGPASPPNFKVFSDSGLVASAATYAFSFLASLAGKHLWGSEDYLAGAVKNDSLGNPYPTGKILAGTAAGAHLLFAGFYNIFYGQLLIGDFGDVDNIRTQAGIAALLTCNVSGNKFVLDTGTGAVKFLVCLPPNFALVGVVDLDALGADVTSQYVTTALGQTPMDANGTVVAGYTAYGMTQSVPYSTSHRHQVTIQDNS
jgi:hypothetical protein